MSDKVAASGTGWELDRDFAVIVEFPQCFKDFLIIYIH